MHTDSDCVVASSHDTNVLNVPCGTLWKNDIQQSLDGDIKKNISPCTHRQIEQELSDVDIETLLSFHATS